MSQRALSVVVAVDSEMGIGKLGSIPWRLPPDIRHFKRLTRATESNERKNALIMGRKTWHSIPARFRPLPGRLNLVLTRSQGLALPDRVMRASSLEEALAGLDARADIERIFVIGGAEVYREALAHPRTRDLYITRIDRSFACDTRFPELDARFQLIGELERGRHDGTDYRIEHWRAHTDMAEDEGMDEAAPDAARETDGEFSVIMTERRTERCVLWSDARSGLRAILVIDDTTLGPAAGGIRTRCYRSLGAAMDEAAQLARAMTLKCALGGVRAGGAKVVVMDHPDMQREAAFEHLGRCLEQLDGAVLTAGDLGTTEQDVAAVARRTRFVHQGGPRLAESLARGLSACLDVVVRFAERGTDIRGLRVAVQGCGTTGAAVARQLAGLGAQLVLADIDHERATRLALELDARTVAADAVLDAEVDVLCPCAIGGTITTQVAREIRAFAVCGVANNILSGPEAGQVLHERGITFVPDIISSAGAVIDGVGERLMGLADRTSLIDALGQTAYRILESSRDNDRAPALEAEAEAWARIRAAASEQV